jgi:chromate transporter
VGYERAGRAGLVVAGACFILPAALITGVIGWFYVTYGSLPAVEPFLYGIKPAVIAVILGAVWKLGRKAVKGWRLAFLGIGVTATVTGGLGEIPALVAGGVLGMFWLRAAGGQDRWRGAGLLASLVVAPWRKAAAASGAVVGSSVGAAIGPAAAGGAGAVISLGRLFLFFLEIGAILYGSGYVLVAFLEGGLVEDLGWLTRTQLLDAIAMGQFTPGPVLSTATFIGYVLAGVPGATVATLGIFLPSFVFVLVLNPLVPRLRRSVWLASFLDAVNVSALGLMVAVTLTLGRSTLTSWPAWVIAAAAAVLVLRFRVNAVWLVLGGVVVGRLLAPWAG